VFRGFGVCSVQWEAAMARILRLLSIIPVGLCRRRLHNRRNPPPAAATAMRVITTPAVAPPDIPGASMCGPRPEAPESPVDEVGVAVIVAVACGETVEEGGKVAPEG
jgi:hypothetical protein